LSKHSNVKLNFLGNQPHDQVVKLQTGSDLLISLRPTLSKEMNRFNKFANSSKIAEYLLTGIPVVATDTDSIDTNLRQFLNFTQRNSDADILRSILQIQNEYGQALKKAKQAIKYVEDNYSQPSVSKKVINFFDNIIRQKNTSVS
jgi:glycosyltransferase involved in cell wall biosynthesis